MSFWKHLIIPLLLFTLSNAFIAQTNEEPGGSYFSLDAGLGPTIDDGGILFSANLSVGYQWSEWLGTGGSLGGHLGMEYSTSSFSGLSVQYRILPARRMSVAIDYGYIFRHSHTTDAYVSEYIPDWYPFFKVHVGWRIGEKSTLGLRFVGLPEVRYEECIDIDSTTGICSPVYVSKELWPTSGFLLTFGWQFGGRR